jgi:hypothetical protein
MAVVEQGTNDSIRYFNLITKTDNVDKEGNRVIVEIVKNGTKYEKGEWVKGLSGFVTHAEIKEGEYEGKKFDKFVLDLKDNDGTSRLEFTNNNASHSLINALLGADLKREIVIEGWISKAGFVNAAPKYKGDRDAIRWVIPLPEQPKPFMKDVEGQEVKMTKHVLDFWLGKFKDIIFKAVHSNYKPVNNALEALEATKSDLNVPRGGGAINTIVRPVVEDDDSMLPF